MWIVRCLISTNMTINTVIRIKPYDAKQSYLKITIRITYFYVALLLLLDVKMYFVNILIVPLIVNLSLT